MDTVMSGVFLFLCLLGTSLQADGSEEYSGALCGGGPGLWPVPADCSSFILCVGGTAGSNATAGRLLHCPPGTAFSAELQTCVPAAQVVGCGGQADKESAEPILIHMLSRQRREEKEGIVYIEEGCKSGVLGPICTGCDQLVICAQLHGQIITPVASVSCSSFGDEQTCSGNMCTLGGTCEKALQPLPFQCLEPGIFPDPDDCNRYHLCGADLGHISDKCDVRYDPESSSCMDIPKEPATVPPCGSPKGCSKMGEIRALGHAPAYYALCLPPPTESTTSKVTYYVTVLRCPNGQLFDDEAKKCRSSCGSHLGRLPVADNCRAYIECNKERSQPRLVTCSKGLAFDAGRRMCLPESQVKACTSQEIITSTPRVNPNATTVSSQAEHVATSPIQATPVTPAVINIPLLQHPICITEGRFVEYSDCRRYMQCWRTWNGALTVALRWCPLFTYFDPTTSACRIGFC